MKGIYVIAIAFLASWAVNATNSDQEQSISKADSQQLGSYTVCPFPQPNEMNTTTNIPHENDCTKFYKCFLGKGIEQLCPFMIKDDPYSRRLHYNRRLEVCDWPWQAGCSSCPGKLLDGTYPPPSRINDNCNYIECINGVGYRRGCSYGTCFSRTCQDCVPNIIGGICNGSPTYTPPPPPTDTTPIPLCINGATKAHECDCGKYYRCDYVDWFLYECSGGLHYSPSSRQCLSPDQANCVIP